MGWRGEETMKQLIVVRGGGDIATGTIHRLFKCGFPVLILECGKPTAIRRKVAFCEAVYDGNATVEGVTCRRIDAPEEWEAVWKNGEIPLLMDEEAGTVEALRPSAVVDAILAKRNLGTRRDMAPVTVGLGPGFTAGVDVDYAIETMRGHNLGRVITDGAPVPDTGIPGVIAGYSRERVIHAPATGTIRNVSSIGDLVQEGQDIAWVGQTPVKARLSGVLRGIIRPGFLVSEGMKIADIDPRESQQKNCYTISDKARCIAGGVLEAILRGGLLQ